MAFLNLGLSAASPYTSTTEGYRVYESQDASVGSAGHKIRLAWSTEYGSDTQDEFILTIYWRAWEKGLSTRTPWSSAIKVTLKPSECNEYQPYAGGRYWWSHNLDLGNLLSQITPNGAFRYDTRLYDSIDLNVSIYSNYTDGAGYSCTSDKASATLYIGHIPKYSITSVYYEESDLVVIEYDTNWTRKDDRYCFEEMRVAGSSGSVLRGKIWGTIVAPGRIELPTSLLTQHIKGRSVYVNLRFNAAYRPIDMDFSNAKGTFKVEDMTVCNTPTLSVVPSGDPYTVRLKTGDRGDLNAPIEKVTVKMTDGKYAADEVTVSAGEIAEMRFCPFGTPLSFEAVGSRGKATSKPARVHAPAVNIGGIAVLDSIPEASRALLEWNQSYSVTTSGNFESVKLAGRRRPSAFYGAGGTTSVRAQAVILDETGVGIEAMPELGDVMLRIHDGRRYALAAQASVSWDGPRIKTVAISGEEVDA